MNSRYWPSITEIDRCIRTEAEELSDETLLAVHEPMLLRKIPARESAGTLEPESELLKHLIASNRPTPILGESGFGKSHIIRWLYAQLILISDKNNYHVIRIPKNVSLRQALERLLQGLPGEVFDEAREKIDSVGESLGSRELSEYLLASVGARLQEMSEDADLQFDEIQMGIQDASSVDTVVRKRLTTIRKHAGRERLQALISDPDFKEQLIGDGKCIFQIAKRMTDGSNDDEIEEDNFEVTDDDLKITQNLSDFSNTARSYVLHSTLHTEPKVVEEVVELLNRCLSDATKITFRQVFQFNSGSFQDLFRDIRKHLLDKGKELFILVEDMSTISAVEDVLIDSLMEEDSPDGVQSLCTLHSAIAVTTGYAGYDRRRDTVSTRAKYEWHIDRSSDDEETTQTRIFDFCGRYLNAARLGESKLKKMALQNLAETEIAIWQSDDKDELNTALNFGSSPLGFPLYPYNDLALRALSETYCRPAGILEFNPRKILQHILQEPLEKFREEYVRGKFPPVGFAGVVCPGNLQGEIRLRVRDDSDRATTLAAIWGWGAQSLGQLAGVMPPEIPAEFGFQILSDVLRNIEPAPGPAPAPGPRPAPAPGPRPAPGQDEFAIEREVDSYFAAKSIPQDVARSLRSALLQAILERKASFQDWYGIRNIGELEIRQPLIHIPYNSNNPSKSKLSFGSEKEFADESNALKYKKFVISVLRSNVSEREKYVDWNYHQGTRDYSNYKNFLDEWLPNSMEILTNLQQEAAIESLKDSYNLSAVIEPRISSISRYEKLQVLVKTPEGIRKLVSEDTGFLDWDEYIRGFLPEWELKQKEWLDGFSTNRHAIEGDLVKKALHGLPYPGFPIRASSAAEKSQKYFRDHHPSLALFEGCNSKESFENSISNLYDLVSKIQGASQFLNMELTARVYKNKLGKLKGQNWSEIKSALALFETFSPTSTISALQNINLDVSKSLEEVLLIWTDWKESNFERILKENEERGGDKRTELESDLDGLIEKFQSLAVDLEDIGGIAE